MSDILAQLSAWWRARTGREQRLLQGAAVVVFAILLPVWAYLSAAAFREAAATRLASARQIEAQVARIAEVSRSHAAGAPTADASLRSRALAAAQAASLTPARVEANSGDRVRITFEPADSLAVYRWIDRVGRGGGYVARSTIVRVQDSDLVQAEFVLTGSP